MQRAFLKAAGVIAASAFPCLAQIEYTNFRNGANLVACGPLGGPSILNRFDMPVEVHDAIAVEHDGEGLLPPTQASATYDTVPSARGLVLRYTGSASRGSPTGFGALALSDARDDWEFTITEPTRFTLHMSVVASSTDGQLPIARLQFLSNAQIDLDQGDPADLSQIHQTPVSWSGSFSGTLHPGEYLVSSIGRIEGLDNVSAWSGIYDLQFDLTVGACPGDFNGDGALNVFDFLAFQTAFSAGDPAADLAAPFGVLNIFDFLEFQSAFSAGC